MESNDVSQTYRVTVAWVLALALTPFVACAHQSSKPVVWSYRSSQPDEAREPGPPFRSYPLSAAFAKNGPRISRDQRAWIERIMNSRNYRHVVPHLRFAVVSDGAHPITVYYAHIDPKGGTDHGGLIIGESCNAFFDPHQFGFVSTPGDVDCSENAKPVE